MFRTLIYPSSGACDYVDELPHRSYCSQFVVCWSFWCDVVIHQHSRKLLEMDILMSETCWAHKWNKIASDIKLVFHSSTILVQSFGLLNHFFPSSSILDKGLPIWHVQPLYLFFNIILPAYLWSSRWPLWSGFPAVYCFDHSCFWHSFDVPIPYHTILAYSVITSSYIIAVTLISHLP